MVVATPPWITEGDNLRGLNSMRLLRNLAALLALVAFASGCIRDSGDEDLATPTAPATTTDAHTSPTMLPQPAPSPTATSTPRATSSAVATPTTPAAPQADRVGYARYETLDGQASIEFPDDWTIAEQADSVQFSEPNAEARIVLRFEEPREVLTPDELINRTLQSLADEFGDEFTEQVRVPQPDGSMRLDFSVQGSPVLDGQVFVEQRGTTIYSLMLLTQFDNISDIYPIFDQVIASYTLPDSTDANQAATESGGTILFEDDFSDTNSGWVSGEFEDGSIGYHNQTYLFSLRSSRTPGWVTGPPPLDQEQRLRVEVEAWKILGPGKNFFGVICRYIDAENYYYLGISSQGENIIAKIKEGNETILQSGESDAIRQGAGRNHLSADCIDDTLTLRVNGVHVGQAQDIDFAAGNVGLRVDTLETGGLDVAFDNFKVIRPE